MARQKPPSSKTQPTLFALNDPETAEAAAGSRGDASSSGNALAGNDAPTELFASPWSPAQLRDALVMIIDAPSLIYQVFHAIDSVTGPTGQQLNAVFGFTRDLLDLIEKRQPDYLFCAFDHREPTFRHKLYADYKQSREAMPDELRPQIPLIHRMLEAMRIPMLELSGYEADDILATVAREAEAHQGRCWLVTNDKDCRQLITDNVMIFNPRKRELMDQAGVLQAWGVRPDQVVDFQTLVGDKIDDIPGVPLIGPKVAQQLLEQFGTLEGIFENIDQVAGPKRRENLAKFQEQAKITRQLVKLDAHVPLAIDWPAARVGQFHGGSVRKLCHELGFRSLADRLQKHSDASDIVAPQRTTLPITLVESPEDCEAMVEQLLRAGRADVLVLTDGRHPRWAELAGLAASTAEQAWYLPILSAADSPDERRSDASWIPLWGKFWEHPEVAKSGPHLKEADVVLRRFGLTLAGAGFDFTLADYLTAAGQRGHELADLADRHLGRRQPDRNAWLGTGKQRQAPHQRPRAEAAAYVQAALEACRDLRPVLQQRLDGMELNQLFTQLELPLQAALADMEFLGVKVDTGLLARIEQEFQQRLAKLVAEIHALAGGEFQIDSRTQLSEKLFGELGLPAQKKTKSGSPSTDSEVLVELAKLHPLPAKLIEYRQVAKLKSTYVDALPQLVHPETGRIHTSFRQDVAATGRLSSQDPNLQNIPVRTADGRRIRAAFVAGDSQWRLVSADYSQIELRVLAHFSRDAELMRAFTDGRDVHAQVAAEIHGVPLAQVEPEMRRRAKAINFGVIYGQSPYGLAKALDIEKGEAAEFIDAYFARYPGVQQFVQRTLDDCRRTGFVSTILGRRREVRGIRSADRRGDSLQRTEPERVAVNTVIQGSAADFIKAAILRVRQALANSHDQARMLLTIHDELLLEAPLEEVSRTAKLLREEMTAAAKLDVPVVVDVKTGEDWASCDPWGE